MTKRLWRALFHTPKHAQKPERQAPMRVSVSLLTMLACCAVLCASSLAWFNDAQAASVASIQAASYSLTVKVGETEVGTANGTRNAEYTFSLSEGETAETAVTRTFTITADGTAKTGYCVITSSDKVLNHAVQIGKDESITLTIKAKMGTAITFTAVWGGTQPENTRLIEVTDVTGTPELAADTPNPTGDAETDENENENDAENADESENGESTDENGEPTDDEQPTRGDDTDNNASSDPSGDNGNENPSGTPEPTTPSDDTSDTENPEGEQSPEPTETPEETEQPTEPEPSENPEPSEAPTEAPDESDVPTEETEPPSDPAPTQESDPVPQGEDAGTSE